jgi:hypothetical protein
LVSAIRHLWHLGRRFAGSLWPGPPSAADESWAQRQLLAGEVAIWRRMSNPDRRHAVGVARAVARQLGPDAASEVVAAALLHDSGKTISGLGTLSRVGATMVWAAVPHHRAVPWSAAANPVVRRLGQYRLHPELGAKLLAGAGAHPLTVAWTAEHHLPASSWTVPWPVGAVLKACDDD